MGLTLHTPHPALCLLSTWLDIHYALDSWTLNLFVRVAEMQESEVIWGKVFRDNFNLDSTHQAGQDWIVETDWVDQ